MILSTKLEPPFLRMSCFVWHQHQNAFGRGNHGVIRGDGKADGFPPRFCGLARVGSLCWFVPSSFVFSKIDGHCPAKPGAEPHVTQHATHYIAVHPCGANHPGWFLFSMTGTHRIRGIHRQVVVGITTIHGIQLVRPPVGNNGRGSPSVPTKESRAYRPEHEPDHPNRCSNNQRADRTGSPRNSTRGTQQIGGDVSF